MEVTLGGDRLGSGNKQKVEMHNYQMSSFNQEQDFKSSMAPGILYPFLKLVGTNHGTFDIDLDSFVRTLPTRGPLFGSFKLQVDIFSVPMRLYQAILHNNPTKIGMKMNQVYLPKIKLVHDWYYNNKLVPKLVGSNKYNQQINESSLLKYIGLSGLGKEGNEHSGKITRYINAIPVLAYYDIFKCYYSNKQEENAYVITPGAPQPVYSNGTVIALFTTTQGTVINAVEEISEPITGNVTMFNIGIKDNKNWEEQLKYITIKRYLNNALIATETLEELINDGIITRTTDPELLTQNDEYKGQYKILFKVNELEQDYFQGDSVQLVNSEIESETKANIKLQPFALQNIDDMRTAILSKNNFGSQFTITRQEDNGDWTGESGTDGTGLPYTALVGYQFNHSSWNAYDMNGLVVKTYQSDWFNNWLDSEWIDGEEGIAALTAISTQDGKFTIDSFVFAEKLYDIYNRIATGGGTYEDWQEAVYGEGAVRKAETPMYIGGMSAEVMFEEVISSAETNVDGDNKALGSLGGKGTQVASKGGHNIHVKCEEPSYIMGIVSLTPRLTYSQGNDWDLIELDSMDDLHKPGLDGIGFQDLPVEYMAWWDTVMAANGTIEYRSSAGKQTAWLQYQTAVDKCYGDFAKQDGYSFMVLNRNYEMEGNATEDPSHASVKDITTYIDPSKFNYAFAYDDLAAQNFWVQIHSKVVTRRKMGAQQIPNL